MIKTILVAAAMLLPAFATSAFAQDANGLANASLATSTSATSCCNGGGSSRYYDYGHANDNAKAVVSNFTQKISAMQLAIIEAMRLQTGQLSGNLREQVGADHTLADQQDDRATVKAVEEARLEAIRQAESSPSACWVITGSRGGSATRDRAELTAKLNTSMSEWMSGESGPSADGQSAALLAGLEVHCQYFGTQADVDSGICEQVGPIPDGDANASQSIFHKRNGVTNTYDDERYKAAVAFMRNAAAPFTFSPIDPSEAQTQSGREKAARRKSLMARYSLGWEPFAEYIANRNGAKDSQLAGWAQDMAKDMAGYEGMDLSQGVSHADWLEIYSKGFLLNPDELAKSDTDMIKSTKEIKNMTAVNLFQGHEQIELLERINLTLAAILTTMLDNTRTDIPK